MGRKLKEILESQTKNKGVIISGFPGVGKSHLVNQAKKSGNELLDSDSSTFDKKNFPENYIKHIKKNVNSGKSILVSSHKEVRDALIKEGMSFVLVYPDESQKEQYIERYKERGSPKEFIELLNKNFLAWTSECDKLDDPHVNKIVLNPGEYLGDNTKIKKLLKIS